MEVSGKSRAQGSFAGPTVSVQPRRTQGAGYLGTDGEPPPRVGRAATVEAVLCDLDDTLYPQAAWLEGAWRAVAAAAARHGIDEQAFLAALHADAALGSARGGIINRALASVTDYDPDQREPKSDPGQPEPDRRPEPNYDRPNPNPTLISHLVTVFRAHRPTRLEPYPGVREALTRLRMAGVRLAVITDGDVDMQAWKVRALGLSAFFECVVVSDALGGRAARKPHSAPFLAALEGLGVGADRCVVVGDRPEKDVTGASGVDIRAIRVKTGEYHQVPDAPGTWHTAADFPGAVDWLLNA